VKLKISYYNLGRLKRALVLAFLVDLGISIFSIIENKGFEQFHLALIIGFILGLPLGIFEEFVFVNRFKRMSFIPALITKGLFYWVTATVMFLVLIYFAVLLLNYPIERYWDFISGGEFLRGVLYTLFVYDFAIVFNQYDRFLGHSLTFLYAYGKYQRPERENRIFLFLDLNSSTELAERMERERYFHFVNDFFHDISEPVLRCSAQIYQYVGDEVVFTWRIKDGLRDANCVRLFFMIQDAIKKNAYRYRSRYNAVPGFKAGLHCGEIIAAVVGDIKKELVYNGDAINTTARIRSACSDLNEDFLISGHLLSKLDLPKKIISTDKKMVNLKGKVEPIHLYSLSKSS